MKEARGIKQDTEFTADDMKEMVARFKAFYKEQKGRISQATPNSSLWKLSRLFSVRGRTRAQSTTAV